MIIVEPCLDPNSDIEERAANSIYILRRSSRRLYAIKRPNSQFSERIFTEVFTNGCHSLTNS